MVKFCPQHCRELIGSNEDESEDHSTPASGVRANASDPYDLSSNDYGLGSNDEAVDDSDEHDVVDDDHNSEDDNNDADDEAGSGSSNEASDDDGNDMQYASHEPHNASVLPSIEGGHQPDREESPTLSASPGENTARDDPDSPHEAKGIVSLSDRDQPDDIMDDSNETEVPNPELPQPQTRGHKVQRPQHQPSSTELGIDTEYLEALPEALRNEVIADTQAKAKANASGTQRSWSRHAIPRSPQHHQRRRSDFLATVLTTSPSPAAGLTQTPDVGGDRAHSHTSAPPGPSRAMPPTGFFSTSTPKPVTRKLFGRSDKSQPRSAPVESANDMDLGKVNGMVTRSQSRRRGRVGTVDEVGEASKVGEGIGMVTRSQGRRRSQARNGVEVQDNQDNNRDKEDRKQEQDIQGEEASRSNKRRKKTEEDPESEEKERKKKTLGRAKRGEPKRSGNMKTYGKRDKRRRV